MILRRTFFDRILPRPRFRPSILWLLAVLIPAFISQAQTGADDRVFAVQTLTRIAGPVLSALADGKLKTDLPAHDWERSRTNFAPLEAFGRTLAGIAPWLELGPDDSAEGKVRAHFIDLADKSLANATDPQSPDFLNFTNGGQPLVDTAFLALGLLRAPNQLWGKLDSQQRSNVVAALEIHAQNQAGRKQLAAVFRDDRSRALAVHRRVRFETD